MTNKEYTESIIINWLIPKLKEDNDDVEIINYFEDKYIHKKKGLKLLTRNEIRDKRLYKLLKTKNE